MRYSHLRLALYENQMRQGSAATERKTPDNGLKLTANYPVTPHL